MTWMSRNRSSLFDKAEFIGWDGEGVNEGMIDEHTIRQKYVLLAVSTGDFLYDSDGIKLHDRLNFIKRIAQNNPTAIHCFYGGSYDFNKILEGLSEKKFDELHT